MYIISALLLLAFLDAVNANAHLTEHIKSQFWSFAHGLLYFFFFERGRWNQWSICTICRLVVTWACDCELRERIKVQVGAYTKQSSDLQSPDTHGTNEAGRTRPSAHSSVESASTTTSLRYKIARYHLVNVHIEAVSVSSLWVQKACYLNSEFN